MTEQTTQQKLQTKYGESQFANFKIIDTIGVPHPYCITPKHLQYADSMYLNKESIEHAETKGAKCGICKGKLQFSEHKQALLVECKIDIQIVKTAEPELREYLLKNKQNAINDNYEGFAFVLKKSDK